MTRIASFLYLSLVIGSTLLSMVAAYQREGKDWRFIEEWLEDDKQKRKSEDRKDFKASTDARQKGTFWNVRKAKGFVNKQAPIKAWKDQDDKEHRRCGIVFYYPNIWDALGRKNGMPASASGGSLYDGDMHLAFERPLAMSPWCTPEPAGDWEKNKPQMIVFQNYWADLDTCMKDRYLFIEEEFGDPQLDKKLTMDVLPIESFTTRTFYNATGYKEDHNPSVFNKPPDAGYVFGLLKEYADANRNGTVPNPWKFGIAAKEWMVWTDVGNFWGYNFQDGSRLPPPENGYAKCSQEYDAKDKRIC